MAKPPEDLKRLGAVLIVTEWFGIFKVKLRRMRLRGATGGKYSESRI